MEPWYDLEDIHRMRSGKEVYNKFRVYARRTQPKHIREKRLDRSGPGRPIIRTFIDRTGAVAILSREFTSEEVQKMLVQSALVPLRLSDAARPHRVELESFSTAGLETPARVLHRTLFIEFLKQTSNGGDTPLLEYDFDPL